MSTKNTSQDDRVVSLEFDNSRFDKRVKESDKTLKDFQETLKFKEGSKGFDKVDKKLVDAKGLKSIQDGLKTLTNGIRPLAIMGKRALENITDSAMNVGSNLTKMFTIDPIKTGLQEYELRMNAVQTIMAGTGEDISNVNKQLEELNIYADKTIYSLRDMTDNVGKFTNAGVKLDVAVDAMKGISNEAALSGASAAEASRAMYNLAQSISMGYVQLIDWKSIENANMATKEFKEQLSQTAVELNVIKKTTAGLYEVGDKTYTLQQLFKDGLATQWLTTSVLTTTLKKYSDEETEIGKKAYAAAQDVKTFTQMMDVLKESAQSGWGVTWQAVIGDLDQAKKFWTSLSNSYGKIIEETADRRNRIFKRAMSNKYDVFVSEIEEAGVKIGDFDNHLAKAATSMGYNVEELINDYGSLGEALHQGKMSLDVIDVAFENLQNNLKLTSKSQKDYEYELLQYKMLLEAIDGLDEESANNYITESGYDLIKVRKLLDKGINANSLSIDDLIRAELVEAEYTQESIDNIKSKYKELITYGSAISDIKNEITKSGGRDLILDSLLNIVDAINNIRSTSSKAFQEIFGGSKEIANVIYKIIESFNIFTKHISEATKNNENMLITFKGFYALLSIIKMAIGAVGKAIKTVVETILSNFGLSIWDVTAKIATLIIKLRDWLNAHKPLTKAMQQIGTVLAKVIRKIVEIIDYLWQLEGTQKAIRTVKTSLEKVGETLKKYFKGGAVVIKAFIDRCKKLDGFSFENLGAALKDFYYNVLNYFIPIDDIVTNIGKRLSAFRNNAIKGAGNFLTVLNNFKDKFVEIVKNFAGNITLSDLLGLLTLIGVIKTLYNAVKLIEMPIKVLVEILNVFKNVLSNFNALLKGLQFTAIAAGIYMICASVYKIVEAIKVLQSVDIGNLSAATVALVAIMGAMTTFVIALSKIKVSEGAAKQAIMILSMTIVLNKITKTLIKLANMQPEQVIPAVIAMVILFGSIGQLMKKVVDAAPDSIKALLATAAMSAGILALSKAIEILGNIKLSNLLVGMIAVKIVFGFLKSYMRNAKNFANNETVVINKNFAKSILAMSGAVILLTYAVRVLSGYSKTDIVKATGYITSVFMIFAALLAVSKIGGEGTAGKIGGAFVGMGIAIIAMSAAIGILTKIKDSDVKKGLTTVAKISLIFLAAMALSKLVGPNAWQSAAVFAGLSISMIAMTGAIAILKNLSPEGMAQALTTITIIGAIFAGVLSLADTNESTYKAITSLTISLGAIGAIVWALGKFSTSDMYKGLGILALIGAVLSGIMASVGYMAKGINSSDGKGSVKKAIKTITSLLLITAGISAIVYGICKLPSDDIKMAISTSASIGILLLAVTTSLNILNRSKGDTFSKVTMSNIGGILAAILGLTVIIEVVSHINTDANIANLITIVGSVSLLLLAISSAMKVINDTKIADDEFLKHIGILTLVTSGLTFLLAVVSHMVSDNASKIPSMIAVVAGAGSLLLTIAKATEIVSKSDVIAKGTISKMWAVVAMAAVMISALAITNKFTNNGKSNNSNIVIISVSVGLLLQFIAESLNRLSGIGTIDDRKVKAMSQLGIIAAILVGLVTYFSATRIPADVTTFAGIGIVCIALAEAVKILGEVGDVSNGALVAIGAMTVVVGALATILAIISTYNIDVDYTVITSLSTLILAMTIAIRILGDASEVSAKSLGSVLSLSALLLAVGYILSIISKMNFKSLPSMATISEMILIMGAVVGLTYVLANISNAIKNIDSATLISGMIKVGEVMLGIGVVVTALSLIGYVMAKLLNDDIIATIIKGIDYIFDIIAAIVKGITSVVLAPLMEFIDEMTDVFEKIAKVVEDENVADHIKAFAEAIGILAGAYLKASIASLIDMIGFIGGKRNSLASMASSFGLLAKGLVSFNDGIKVTNFDIAKVKSAAEVCEILVKTAKNLPRSGGLIDSIIGTRTTISKFGTQMAAYAEAVVSFSSVLSDADSNGLLNIDLAQKAANVGNVLSSFAKTLPKQYGFVQAIFGQSVDLDVFGQMMETFTGSVIDICSNDGLKNVSEDKVTAVKNVGEMFSALANSLPKEEEGFFKRIHRINLKDFGSQMEDFADSVVSVNEKFMDVTLNSSFKNIGDIAKPLAEVYQMLPNVGGIASWFKGGKRIDKFADGMIELVGGIAGITEYMQDNEITLDKESMESFKMALHIIKDLYTDGSIDTAYEIADKGIGDFASIMSRIGEGINTFAKSIVNGITIDELNSATMSANSVNDMMNVFSGNGFNNFLDSYKNTNGLFKTLLSDFASGIVGFINTVAGNGIAPDYIETYTKAGVAVVKMFEAFPKQGGWFQKIFGGVTSSDITEFAKLMPELGGGIVGFVNKIVENSGGQKNFESFANANLGDKFNSNVTTVTNAIVTLYKTLQNGEIVISNSDAGIYSTIGGYLGTVFSSLSILTNSMTDEQVDRLTNVISSIDDYALAMQDFVEAIKSISVGYSLAKEAVDNIYNASGSGGIDTLRVADILYNAGLDEENAFKLDFSDEEINDGADRVTKVMVHLVESFKAIKDAITDNNVGDSKQLKTDIENYISSYESIVRSIPVTIANGITEMDANTANDFAEWRKMLAGSKFIVSLKESMNNSNIVDLFKEVGRNYAKGIAAGMTEAEPDVDKVNVNLAQRLVIKLNKALDIHSPSRKSRKSGRYFAQGLGLGIRELSNYVASEGKNLAEVALDSVNGTINNIQSMMYSDDRNTLTITPVLNLDQVQNGVNNMKGLFNSVSNIGYTPSIAGTNYRMSNRYNDSTRSDLVNAINGLNGTSVNNTYNVNGITYDDGSNVAAAVGSLIRAAKIDRRT